MILMLFFDFEVSLNNDVRGWEEFSYSEVGNIIQCQYVFLVGVQFLNLFFFDLG